MYTMPKKTKNPKTSKPPMEFVRNGHRSTVLRMQADEVKKFEASNDLKPWLTRMGKAGYRGLEKIPKHVVPERGAVHVGPLSTCKICAKDRRLMSVKKRQKRKNPKVVVPLVDEKPEDDETPDVSGPNKTPFGANADADSSDDAAHNQNNTETENEDSEDETASEIPEPVKSAEELLVERWKKRNSDSS
jgi:hypothetical protein